MAAVTVAISIQLPLISQEILERKITPPPVIIQLENIPETHQQVTAPAPALGIPLEVGDDVVLDDITIEDTSLDFETVIPVEAVKPVIVQEVPIDEEPVEEEIFEFFAVEEQPVRVSEVAPEYPEAARQANIEGTVFVRALVGTEGRIEQAEVLKGPELLHAAAIQAALATTFTPAKQNGMAVKCWVQMRFAFELEK
jgi:protein TonB